MKKTIIVLIAVAVLLIGITVGSGLKNPEPPPTSTSTTTEMPMQTSPPPSTQTSTQISEDNTDTQVTQTVYDKLCELSEQEYSSIKIDIVVTTGFAELYSNYVLTQNNMVYSVDKLNLLPSDGNITDLPSNYKTTVTGYALIENGEVVDLDGNKDITLPSYDELKGIFNFDENNFKNAVVGTNSLEADVISPPRFYGTDVDMSNLKVKVEYTETALTKIIISYSTTNSTVQTVYVFEN